MKLANLLRQLFSVLFHYKDVKTDSVKPVPPEALLQNQDVDLNQRPNCPRCQATDVARIVYGKPALTRQVLAGLESGQIVSGGCLVHPGAPQWRCNRCHHDFGQLQFQQDGQGERG